MDGVGTRTRGRSADLIGVGAAVVATVVTYTIFFIHPWPHTPLNQFLAMFDRNNAAVWPMQIVWYVAAAAMVGLALRPTRRASQLVCVLAAAYLAWIGVAYFAWLNPGMNLSWAWAAVFTLEAVLVLVAGIGRSDLVFRPRWNLASALGGAFIVYALVAYPAIGLLGGHPLHTVPVFGLSPCATVIFFFGLLLWARPPAPMYLLPLPLVWALVAAPPDLARGVVADFGMVVTGVATAGLLIWRDRTSIGLSVASGLILVLMIAWSGHDNVLIGLALVLVAVSLWQATRDRAQSPGEGLPHRLGRASEQLKVA